jgi:hypothetical protein
MNTADFALFRADKETDRHEESIGHFPQIPKESSLKMKYSSLTNYTFFPFTLRFAIKQVNLSYNKRIWVLHSTLCYVVKFCRAGIFFSY